MNFLIKTCMVMCFAIFLSSCGGASNDTASSVASMTLTASDQSLSVGTQSIYSRITAQVIDQSGNPVIGAKVHFETNLGSLSASEAKSDNQGRASVLFYPGNISGAAVISAFVNGYQQTITIDVRGQQSNVSVSSLTLVAANDQIIADGSSVDKLTATVLNGQGEPISGKTVQFSTNNGMLLRDLAGGESGASLNVESGASGEAVVYLQSSTLATTAQVSATVEGVNTFKNVDFIAGEADSTVSQITLSPSTIPADGISTSEVDVLLLDKNSNIVADGTSVTIETTLGTVTTDNPTVTSLGHATFTIQAATQAGDAVVKVREYPDLNATLVLGAPTTGEPFNIFVTPESNSLFVKGVGKQDSMSIAIEVRDSAGNLIQDADAGVNNLKVSFVASPQSGEALVGTDANNQSVTSTSSLSVRTVNGTASISLKSGTRPGVVELKIEALDNSGVSLSPPIVANVSEIAIASGPPHNIAVSYPSVGAVTNLGNGIYQRVGSLSVTDQYGNAVPDGTVVNLGFLDRILVSNTTPAVNATADDNASIVSNNRIMKDNTNTNLNTLSITSNATSRNILPNDRVLILNAQSNDKARFVQSVNSSSIVTNKDYRNTQNNLSYLVGSALLGGQVLGVNAQSGEERTGLATTQNGVATFKITYPADNQHILTGCYGDPTIDTRVNPIGSAQTWLIAESNETGAATVDNRGCFAAVEPFVLTNLSNVSTISSTTTVSYQLEDANQINLPFETLSSTVVYDTNTGGLSVSVGNCSGRTDQRTNANGTCALTISVSGGNSGDSATVTISAPGRASADSISVTIP